MILITFEVRKIRFIIIYNLCLKCIMDNRICKLFSEFISRNMNIISHIKYKKT